MLAKSKLPTMEGSLLEDTLRFCHLALLEVRDSEARRALVARVGILERATWSLELMDASATEVMMLARLVLDLRTEVERFVESASSKASRMTR